MNIVQCPICGAKMDWLAKTCPHCGAPLNANRKMTECRTCGEFIAKDAKLCPYCGTRNPNKSVLIAKIIFAFIFFAFFALFISSLGTSDDAGQTTQPPKNSSATVEPSESEEPTTPEYIEVTAEALWNAYQENEVNADLLYGDKLLAVTGTITDIGKDIITEAPCISLDSGSAYNIYPIQCFFPKNGEQTELIASLSDGNTVTIYGTCTGEFVQYVQLSKCYLATD